jgi:serine protease Do
MRKAPLSLASLLLATSLAALPAPAAEAPATRNAPPATAAAPATLTPPQRIGTDTAQQLYDAVTPSLVAVKYTWDSERGRQELIGAGVVVGDDGLIMTPITFVDMRIPDAQMKDFKIIIPRRDVDNEEIDAILVGRDERTNVAFVRPKNSDGATTKRTWKPIHFVEQPVRVGQPVFSVGILPKAGGYRSYYAQGVVGAQLRGEIPWVLVTGGGLAAMGAPVFNASGSAIGFVGAQAEQIVFLNDPRNTLVAINNPPNFFVPTRDFLQSLQDPPVAGKPLELPWVGLPQLTGLNKDVAEFFGLKNQPAVQVGDVIPDSPAEKAGLKRGMIIVKLNGKPLERGDEPEEIPAILRRNILRMKVGDKVTFSVMTDKDKPLQQITVTLDQQPKRANLAERFFAEDLGFSVREIVFYDTYARKLPADQKGVIVSWIKPQSSAETGKLQGNDLITELNGTPVTSLDEFKTSYEAFRKDHDKEAVVMVVKRDGTTQVIRIEPPQ